MNKLTPFIACLFLYSCSINPNENNEAQYNLGNSEANTPNSKAITSSQTTGYHNTAHDPSNHESSIKKGSKIIKQGKMVFEVTKIEEAKSKVDSFLKSAKGYYENEHYSELGHQLNYTLKLRIPNATFDSLVDALEKNIGKLLSKKIDAKDVTEEYVDLNIRLDNNLAYLKQYKTILAKAKKIEDILKVQEKIRRIEEEIESKKGRIKYLDDQVNFSTLAVHLSEPLAVKAYAKPGFGKRIAQAFNNGIGGLLSFIVGLVNIWPLLVAIVLSLVLLKRPIIKKISTKKPIQKGD